VTQSKMNTKADAGTSGPVVRDPDDGTIRTPKGLLHTASMQLNMKQLAGFMTNDEPASHPTSEVSGTFMDMFPSLGNFSTFEGSVTPAASEQGEIESVLSAYAREADTARKVSLLQIRLAPSSAILKKYRSPLNCHVKFLGTVRKHIRSS
jgi:hypothetical protein